ncbi:hypothetical protein AAE478_008151 [Parahypoxylon ruwenzoriense]
MSGILGSISSWAKSPAPKSTNGSHPRDKESRGTKRKAKGDPYDEIDDDDEPPRPPSTHRSRPRISSEAPGPSTKGRQSSAGKANQRRSRSWGAHRGDVVDRPRVDAPANLSHGQQNPHAAQPQANPEPEHTQSSLVPTADMGGHESSRSDENATNGTIHAEAKPTRKTSTGSDVKGKAKTTEVDQAKKSQAKDQATAGGPEADNREEHEVHALLQHRMAQDNSGRVELLVHWDGEKEEGATWELEEEIQKGAGETLYAYWKARGGRVSALFIKPKNPPPETYHVFKILKHEKKARGGFEFEVQWVGHSLTRGETSKEAETKLKNIAPEALKAYWESIGGRDRFLAKRGRGKKGRAD